MIKIIEYKIKFPLNAEFFKDPEILFLSKIYNEIYKCTCINKQNLCNNCQKKQNCIYYFLSGENFSKYPAIGIKRSIINKRRYFSNDVLSLKFYLIGVAANYSEFITAFMQTEETIGKHFFQKVLVKNELLNTNTVFEGNVQFKNVVIDTEDIINSIHYYNEKYKCNFDIPIFEEIKYVMQVKDETLYRICNNYVRIKGKTFKVRVKKYSNLFFDIGLGKYGFIGGGQASCELE